MCTISVPCPLCSQTSFTSVTSLRISLIKAINSPLSCPICPEILMGLDKLTLHLITHNNNLINCDENKCINICTVDQKKIEENLNCELKSSSTITTTNAFFNPIDIFKNNTASLEIATNNTTELDKLKLNKDKLLENNIHNDFHKSKMENIITNINNIKNENNIEPKCDICGIIFGNYDVLDMHKKVMHQVDINNCIISLTANTTTDPVEQNMNNDNDSITNNINNNNNNNNLLKMFPCHLCSKSYKMKARLRLHLKVKHLLGLSAGGNDKLTPKLNICEKIRMINMKQQTLNLDLNSSQKTIINNNITSTSINNFIPQIPDQKQNSSSQFSENGVGGGGGGVGAGGDISLIENGQNDCNLSPRSNSETSKTWKCDYCSKFYTTKYFLKKHKRIHTGETPYTCEICKKSFTFQQSYHKHLLYHSDEKPHICVTCGRAFKELSTLHNHERIHSGEKPFECETCGKRFRQRVSNYVHQRTHTGVKPYTCQLCQKTFRYKVTLRTHKCSGDINNHQPPISPLSSENLSSTISEEIDKKLFTETNEISTKTPIEISDLNEDSLQKLFQNTSIFVEPSTSKDLHENDNIITNDMNEEMLSKTIDEIVAESCRNLFKDQSCESSSFFTS